MTQSAQHEPRFPESGLCLGIDPDPHLAGKTRTLEHFKEVLNQHDTVLRHLQIQGKSLPLKPNLAFFIRFGAQGLALLEEFVERQRTHHPILLDAKFGEISSSLEAYLDFAFGTLGAHALTLNPFLGEKTLEQAVERALASTEGTGRIYVLCATSQHSHADLAEIQQVEAILHVCSKLAKKFAHSENAMPVGVVIGATRADVLQSKPVLESGLPLLCPGLGAQGGDLNLASTLQRRAPCLFPISRGIFHGGASSTGDSLQHIDYFENQLSGSLKL